jgi:hypothetical protein
MSLIERPDDPEQVALLALRALRELSDLGSEGKPPARTEIVLYATTAITHALLEVASAIRDAAP